MSENGRALRLGRILGHGHPTLVFTVDGGLIDGPVGSLRTLPELMTPSMLQAIDGLLAYRGVIARIGRQISASVGIIENVSASTAAGDQVDKVAIGSVESAIRNGADAVAFQLHLTGEGENAMLQRTGKVVGRCQEWGMPVLLTTYPRRRGLSGVMDTYDEVRRDAPEEYTRMVTHCVRVAVELGADVVKTTFTGSAESFAGVVDSALDVPVLVAGGAPSTPQAAGELAAMAVHAGAQGVAFGRHIYGSHDPEAIVRIVRACLDANLREFGAQPGHAPHQGNGEA